MENQTNTLEEFLGIEGKTQEVPKDLETFFPSEEIETQEQEEEVVDEKEVVKKEEEVQAPQTESIYNKLLQEYIEEGDWADGQIEIENENGEVETVLLSELKNVDSKLFKQIKEGQKALKDEEIKSKYISVEGLDDTTKKLIEAQRAGADISGLIQEASELVHPLKNYDLENEQVQENLIRWNLKSKGEEDDDIEYKIQKYKKNFTLDTEASKIVKIIDSEYDKKVTETLENQKRQNEEALESQKVFKKTILEVYKELKLDENLTKSLVDSAAKFDKTGLSQADRLYFESKNDPKLHAEIVFHLTNSKAFNEFKGVKIKNAVTNETILKISRIPKQAASAGVKKDKQEEIDPLEKFFS